MTKEVLANEWTSDLLQWEEVYLQLEEQWDVVWERLK